MNFKKLRCNLFLRMVTHIPMSNSLRVKFSKLGGVNVKGSRCHIGEGVIFDSLYPEEIVIENHVHVTMRCIILTHNFNTKNRGTKYWSKGHVHICEGAFIGANTVICNTVRIGKWAVVGAGSVVTKDIPDYEVWGGNPAHFIKKRDVF